MRGIFVKTMFGFKESRAKVPHKLKMHMRGAISVSFVYSYVKVIEGRGIF